MKAVEDFNPNWIGDGFPSHAFWYYGEHDSALSPYFRLGFFGPFEFSPVEDGGRRQGVGAHPHRDFEAVLIVYKGGVEHRDSTGQSGVHVCAWCARSPRCASRRSGPTSFGTST